MSLLSRRQILEGIAASVASVSVSPAARADIYPSRPIRLVIPFAAGGSNDQVGRPWVDKVGPSLGSAYIENIGGAGGAIGCTAVAHAAPDGYSLLLGNIGNQAIIPLASSRPAYESIRDFRAVYGLVNTGLAFAVHPSLPVQNLRELATYAKAHPGKVSYGSAGVGTSNNLVGEMYKQQSGATDIVHVPYRGAGPAITDLIGGQLSLVVAVVSGQLLQAHQAGQLRILAVTTGVRMSAAPDIPTTTEVGMPDLRLDGWFGLFAPKATPDTIVERIANATTNVMTDSALRDAYRVQGMEPVTDSTPARFQQLVGDELKRLAPIIKAIDFKLE